MTEDKELAALRERVEELEVDLSDWRDLYSVENADRMSALARAETAERELAALSEALKPFSTLARWLPTKTPDDEVVYRASAIVIKAGDLRRAARAITGGKL